MRDTNGLKVNKRGFLPDGSCRLLNRFVPFTVQERGADHSKAFRGQDETFYNLSGGMVL
jgi:hypothetical protein